MTRWNHREMVNYVLVPGSWHADQALRPLAERIERYHHYGSERAHAHTPNIAWHNPDRPPTREATLADQVDSLVSYVEGNGLRDVVLYGHSSGGVLLMLAAPRLLGRLRRLVFHSAFIPESGQSIYDTLPPAYVGLFRSITDPQTNSSSLPFDLWRNGFVQDVSESVARDLWETLVPEPAATADTPVDAEAFDSLVAQGTVPMSYLLVDGDTALPVGHLPPHLGGPVADQPPLGWGWTRFVSRLGFPRVVRIPVGSHESALTSPMSLARAVVHAGRD